MRATAFAIAVCALVAVPAMAQDSGGGVNNAIRGLNNALNPSDRDTSRDRDRDNTRRSSSRMHFTSDADMRREQSRLDDAKRQLDDANQRYREERADFDDAQRDYQSRR